MPAAIGTLVVILTLSACAMNRTGLAYARPASLVAEWVDVEKSTPDDTTLWVLRSDGYDGAAHLLAKPDSTGALVHTRAERRYGSWYLDGTLGDSARQAICFSRRPGRFGATCTHFVMDTLTHGVARASRLLLREYKGEHHTRDRLLVARAVNARP